MNQKIKVLLLFTFFIFVLIGARNFSLADDDDHKEEKWHHQILDWDDDNHNDGHYRRKRRKRHRGDDHDGGYLKPVNNPTYETECGECHFLYQPELLPSSSWIKILNRLDDHFGEEIELDPDSKKIISNYLKSNGADNFSAKLSAKIMRSLRNNVPMRITDIPYIREKHHEINAEVLKRESIGALSNCVACHTTAEKGIYEDDHVKIPK